MSVAGAAARVTDRLVQGSQVTVHHERQSSRLVRRYVTMFFFAVLAVYAVTADYDQAQNSDVIATVVPVWNLVANGSLDITSFEDLSPWIITVDGRTFSNRWPGTMAVALVGYVVTAPFHADSDGPVYWPGTVMAVVVSAIAATVLFRLLWSLSGGFGAVAAMVVAFGTGLWAVAADALWTHGPSVLASSLAMYALRRNRQWWAGICFGCMALIRPHLLIVAFVVGCVLAREVRDSRVLLRIGVPSAVGLAIYAGYVSVVSQTLSLGVSDYVFYAPQGWTRLVSPVAAAIAPRVGLVIYTPVVLCCLPKLAPAWRAALPWERAVAFGGLAYVIVQLQLNRFFGGFGFYGHRLLIEGVVLALPLLCRSAQLYFEMSNGRAVITSTLAVASVWITAVGAVFHVNRREVLHDPLTTWGPTNVLAGQPAWLVATVYAVGLCGITCACVLARRRRVSWCDKTVTVSS